MTKQLRYVTVHLHLYVANNYHFCCTIDHLLLTMYLTFVNANISSNTAFTAIVIFHQIFKGPMDLFFYKLEHAIMLFLTWDWHDFDGNFLTLPFFV